MNRQLKSSAPIKPSQNDGEKLDLGKLGSSLGFLLRMAQIEIFEFYHAELGEHGLKPGEFSVFWLVSENPGVRQGLVAKSLCIKQAHMTKLVRNLEKRDLISREIPDADRRSVLLNVTENGRQFIDRIEGHFFGHFFAEGNSLTKRETKTLITLLQKFTDIQESGQQ